MKYEKKCFVSGLFEAARLSNPILPQYHPKQLMELLNAGKTKRVKAILQHVLRTIQIRKSEMLFRQASMRSSSTEDAPDSLHKCERDYLAFIHCLFCVFFSDLAV